jgi:cytidylate kinase
MANVENNHSTSGQPVPADHGQHVFTVEEHLHVQREIEERAHRQWNVNGCALDSALHDWLKAEKEVLAEFAQARMQFRPMRSASLFRLAALF